MNSIIRMLPIVLLGLLACSDGDSATASGQYLADPIPPCTPVEGSAIDPCDPNAPPIESVVGGAPPPIGDTPRTLRDRLDESSASYVTHIILRGTYLPNTARCIADVPVHFQPHVGVEFGAAELPNSRMFKCFIDVRANEYLVGSGPPTLSVNVFSLPYHPEGTNAEHGRQVLEAYIDESYTGREDVLFLGPPAEVAIEAWQLMDRWNVERNEDDDTVVVVHPIIAQWYVENPEVANRFRSRLLLTLSAFKTAIVKANTLRVSETGGRVGTGEDLPDLVTDANNLSGYYADAGVTLTPSEAPPPCGKAVPDQANNPGLMQDCFALLGLKDELAGSAALNWSVDVAMAEWDGVTTEGGV